MFKTRQSKSEASVYCQTDTVAFSVLTTTSPPSAGTNYPTRTTTYKYSTSYATSYPTSFGTYPPAACIISLHGKEGTFGDHPTLVTTNPGPSVGPTLLTTTPITSPSTTPTASPTTSSTDASTCIKYKQWKIKVPKGHYVEMTLESINLGPGACLYDMYVIVKDGHSTSSNVLYIQCEPDVVPRAVWSSGNEMLVERYGSISRSSANTEFKARYKAKLLSEGGQYTASFSYDD